MFDMPRLWRREDGCLIIKGIIHNQDEDNCTWQVDDARNTIALLNAHGIDTNVLPVKFPLTLVVKLKRLRWISTANNAGPKAKPSKSKKAAKKRGKKSGEKRRLSGRKNESKKKPKPTDTIRPRLRWYDPLSVSVSELAQQLKVAPIQVMNEAGRRGFKVVRLSDKLPNKVASWIREYFRPIRRKTVRR